MANWASGNGLDPSGTACRSGAMSCAPLMLARPAVQKVVAAEGTQIS
jgi:hypothetical protein